MSETIGDQLSTARQEQGLTLEQISQTLHIRVGYLKALEANRWEDIPSEVQGRGFLRLYAGQLNLPVQPLLNERQAQINALNPEPEPQIKPIKPPRLIRPTKPAVKAPPVSPVVAEPETDWRAILIEIGQVLQERRQTLGLKLDDVEQHTHIRQHYAQALETGQFDELPSPVQGRGMLANYARFLDLDSDPLMERYAEALQLQLSERVNSPAPEKVRAGTASFSPPLGRGQARSERPATSSGDAATQAARSGSARRAPARPQAAWRRFVTPDMVIVGALIVVVVGAILWTLASVTGSQNQNGQPTLPSIAELLLKTGTPGTPLPTGAGLPGGTATLAPGGGAGLAPATPTFPAVTAKPVTSGVLQVYIVARQRAYLKVTVDGKIMFDGRVVPGNAYSFGGNQRIDMLTGNAAALQVLFNQTDLGNLGLVGQVRALIFTDKGVVTPTPSFSPTPTRTQQPTSTLRPSQVLPSPTITPFIP